MVYFYLDMKEFAFATGNKNKVIELNKLMEGLPFSFVTMGEIGFHEEIPETGATLEENALIKARYLSNAVTMNVISEDTGLEVEALDWDPGVYTARYGGPEKDANKNMDLLIKNLNEQSNRTARFRTIVALIMDGQEFIFEGICNGTISKVKKGEKGFGYDPIFIPEGEKRSFAEMTLEEKSEISHRARAFNKMYSFLKTKSKNEDS